MACFIGKFPKNNSAGIIKKPPPAPKKPVIKPTKSPIIAIRKWSSRFSVSSGVDVLIIDKEAAIIRKANTVIMTKFFDISKEFTVRIIAGIFGKITSLTKSNESTEGIAKTRAALIFRFPSLYWLKLPNIAVIPTINKE